MKTTFNPKLINLYGIRFPQEWIFLHLICIGGTGSGKTRGVLRPLISQLAAADLHSPELRPAMVIFDVKGDLKPIVEVALKSCGRTNDLITVGVGASEAVFNPIGDPSLTPSQIAQQLTSASSLGGPEAGQRSKSEELFWSTARMDLLTSLIELTQTTLREAGHGQLAMEHLQRARGLLTQTNEKLREWVSVVSPILSEASAAALKEWSRLPADTTRGCVTASVGNILAPWARTPLSRLVNPEPGRPTLNLHDVVQRGKVVVLNVGQAEHAEELWPGCMLLKEALFRLALSRSRLPINQKRMVAIVMDEANRLLSGQNHLSAEHVAMEMARSNRVSFILACQNLSGLNAVSGDTITDKLMALCGTLVFLTNNCPTTLRLAQRIFGTHLVMRAHRTTVPALAPPQLFLTDEPDEPEPAQVTQVPTEVPLISAETLSRLPAGAARAKLADGSVHEFQCTFD